MNQIITEHKRALASLDYNMSAVAERVIKTDHNIGWEDFEILDSQELYKRCYLESWHIRKEKGTMNRDNGVLPKVYNCLISRQNKS